MSEISKTIDAVLEPLRPVMKQLGFAKSGRNWRRRRDSSVQVVNVQASYYNTDESGTFTVNLGVYFPAVDEIVGERPAESAPSEASCDFRKRIGRLMPAGRDYWWEVRPGAPLLEISDEVVEAVTTLGLPWLDAHSSLEVLLARAGESLYYYEETRKVAICLALGRQQEAAEWLTRLRDRFLDLGRPDDAEYWLAWGLERGVVVA